MASLVQVKSAGDDASGGTIAATFDADTTTGNAIIAVVACISPADTQFVSGIADGGDSFSGVVFNRDNANYGYNITIWAALNITGATTPTVTATLNSSYSERRIAILEYSGIATSSATDQTAGNDASGAVPDPGQIAPSESGTVIVAASCNDASGAAAATGFSEAVAEFVGTDAPYIHVIHEIQAGQTTRDTFWTAASGNYTAVAANFKTTGGGGGGATGSDQRGARRGQRRGARRGSYSMHNELYRRDRLVVPVTLWPRRSAAR